MSAARATARLLVPPVVVALRQRIRAAQLQRTGFARLEPFGYGYIEKREALLAGQAALVAAGADVDALPLLAVSDLAHVDERPVEYAWALDRLRGLFGERLLDVGCVLNRAWCAPQLASRFEERWYLNLAYEPLEDIGKATMLVGDARACPLPDAWFDVITCLSTLEHVGMDNSLYTGVGDRSATDAGADLWGCVEPAVVEFRRLLRPGGRLLITVPFGRSDNRGWFQVFDAERISRLREALGPGTSSVELFRVDPMQGWVRAEVDECRAAVYGSGVPAASAIACISFERAR